MNLLPLVVKEKLGIWMRESSCLLLLLGLAIGFVFPFLWMLSTSFTPSEETLTTQVHLLPKDFTLRNYVEVFRFLHFERYLFNSFFVAVMVLVGQFLTIIPAAYVFAKRDFPGKNFLFYGFLASMMIPHHITIIPVYLLLNKLGWINTYQGLIVPFFTSAFGVFLLRQFFMTVPNDLLDAARMDGCSEVHLMWGVLVRSSMPALTAFAIFSFVRQWNNYFWVLIVVEREELFTVPLAMGRMQDWELGIEWGYVMAAATVAIAPLVVLFFLAQKKFVEGITMTGFKE